MPIAHSIFAAGRGNAWTPGAAVGLAGAGEAIAGASGLLDVGGGGAAFPLSYNDPAFTGMSTLSGVPGYDASGQTVSYKQIPNDLSGDAVIGMWGSCTIDHCRMVTVEGPRMGATAANSVCTINWCYIENHNEGDSHADGIQCYGTFTNTPKPILRLRNTHMRGVGGAHACIFGANSGEYLQILVDIEDCLFSGDGTCGNAIKLYNDHAPGSTLVQLRMKNVYITEESTWEYGTLDINKTGATNPINVVLWENVRYCTLVGGVFTPGDLIPQPSGT